MKIYSSLYILLVSLLAWSIACAGDAGPTAGSETPATTAVSAASSTDKKISRVNTLSFNKPTQEEIDAFVRNSSAQEQALWLLEFFKGTESPYAQVRDMTNKTKDPKLFEQERPAVGKALAAQADIWEKAQEKEYIIAKAIQVACEHVAIDISVRDTSCTTDSPARTIIYTPVQIDNKGKPKRFVNHAMRIKLDGKKGWRPESPTREREFESVLVCTASSKD